MATGKTPKANMVIPEVMADMISAALPNKIRFAPLADVDSTLVGVPGDTVTVPAYAYIGDAADVAEGEAIPMTQLTTADVPMTIKKAGKGVEITDEALLSGLGDPKGESSNQIAMSIAAKVDNDLLTALATATQPSTATGGLTVANLDEAIGVFDDEDLEPMILIANPVAAAVLIADAKTKLMYSERGADAIISGSVGMISGAEIVRSRKVTAATAYLVKRGALKLVKKRDVAVETDRDIVKKTTVITGDQHYGTYLYDQTKVVKITITA